MHDQVIVVHVSIDTARGETGVILEPVDATDTVHMTLALIVLRAVLGVKVVHPDGVGSIGACEEVSSIAEFDFFTSLNLEGAWLRGKLLA